MKIRYSASSRFFCRAFFLSVLGVVVFLFAEVSRAATIPDFQLQNLTAQVQKLRQLQFKKPVSKEVQSPEAFKKFLNERIDIYLPPKEIKYLETGLKKLGFISENEDVKQKMMNLYMTQALGYYDEKKHTLFLLEDSTLNTQDALKNMPGETFAGLNLDIRDFVLLHELDHALVDQHYPLEAMTSRAKTSDAQLALSALIEGDALFINILSVLSSFGIPQEKMADLQSFYSGFLNSADFSSVISSLSSFLPGTGTPDYFTEMLAFPYFQGFMLVQNLFLQGGWATVNMAYKYPPQSTEHILHKEKYFSHEGFETIRMDEMKSFGGYAKQAEDTAGEFGMAFLLGQYIPKAKAQKAAEGWNGDLWRVYEDKKTKNTAVVWKSAWDSYEDAVEFFEAAQDMLKKRFPECGKNISPSSKSSPLNPFCCHAGDDYAGELLNDHYVILSVAEKTPLLCNGNGQ